MRGGENPYQKAANTIKLHNKLKIIGILKDLLNWGIVKPCYLARKQCQGSFIVNGCSFGKIGHCEVGKR